MEVSGLLSSWTTPAASWPRVASRSERNHLLLERLDLGHVLADRDDGLDRTAGGADPADRGDAPHGRDGAVAAVSASATVTAAWCWPIHRRGEHRRQVLALVGGEEGRGCRGRAAGRAACR